MTSIGGTFLIYLNKLWLLSACVLLYAVSAWAQDGIPQKVISLNLCTDQLALVLAKDGQLHGVSFNAADAALSPMHQRTGDLQLLRSDAEEIAAIQPDLVLMGEYDSPLLQRWLKSQNIPVLALPIPESLEDIQTHIRQIAQALRQEAAGEALIAETATAFSTPYPAERAPTLAVYYPRGYTDGTGTLMHDMLVRLGVRHLTTGNGTRHMDMEEIVTLQPDILLLQDYGYEVLSQGETLLHHPALQHLQAKRLALPGAWMMCPHLYIGNVASRIRHAWQP